MYDFTAFIPPHRCNVALCDEDGDFEQDFLNFTTPWDQDGNNWEKCDMFGIVWNGTGECKRDNFLQKEVLACSNFVFDHEMIR